MSANTGNEVDAPCALVPWQTASYKDFDVADLFAGDTGGIAYNLAVQMQRCIAGYKAAKGRGSYLRK